MKHFKYPKFGTVLLWMAALVNLARWTGVFTLSKHSPAWITNILPVFDAISGLVTGLVIAGGLAFVAHRLGGLQPFTSKGKPVMRFWGSILGELAILIMSAFLLPPYIRMTMPVELRAEIPDVHLWSVMAVLVGDLIIVAIALADVKAAGFTRSKDERPQKVRSAKGSGRSARDGSRSKPLSQAKATVECRYAPQCERTFTKDTMVAARNAANAHARTCGYKPTVMMPEDQNVENT